MKALVLIAFALFSVGASGACWEDIGGGTDSIIYVDACSISMEKSFKKAWFRTIYVASEDLENNNSIGGERYNKVKSLIYFDCKHRKSNSVVSVYYNDDKYINRSF